uniref:UDP-N-acetylglucosamine transferase subunit ALG14 n=1 Tax=Naja naja TaxID=35670 RepID=A0A8C6VB73_NAJNA
MEWSFWAKLGVSVFFFPLLILFILRLVKRRPVTPNADVKLLVVAGSGITVCPPSHSQKSRGPSVLELFTANHHSFLILFSSSGLQAQPRCDLLVGDLASTQPQVLCNGPGTCVPICLSALLLKILGLNKITIVYVESICRVENLSLSGKILYHFSDYFIVQWPALKEKYPKSLYFGRIV